MPLPLGGLRWGDDMDDAMDGEDGGAENMQGAEYDPCRESMLSTPECCMNTASSPPSITDLEQLHTQQILLP